MFKSILWKVGRYSLFVRVCALLSIPNNDTTHMWIVDYHVVCFNEKHCVKIIFHIFQCLVASKKLVKGKLFLLNVKDMVYF